jgi:hypothetical protein
VSCGSCGGGPPAEDTTVYVVRYADGTKQEVVGKFAARVAVAKAGVTASFVKK